MHGSGTALPFADDSFDLVLTVAALHHIAEPDDVRETLAEMVRVARPAGRSSCGTTTRAMPTGGVLMARVPQDTGDERLIPEEEVVDGLRRAGARLLSSDQLGLVPDFVPRAALGAAQAVERAVERTPLAGPLGAHNVVLATK